MDNENQAAIVSGVEAGAQKITENKVGQQTEPGVKQAKVKKIKTTSNES